MNRRPLFLALATFALLAASGDAQPPRRRALLIGIDDYTASSFPRRPDLEQEHRGWPDLKGAANDARILREMLVLLYGFAPDDIVTLTNQQATRAAILQSIERHLAAPSRAGDVVFYYFAGHGSQVPNPDSDEPDGLDESIVPADSRAGALDIRDKELRPLFNRILDRGAQLTLLLDHCHSGSGFRGLPTGARPRGIRRAREIADPKVYGPLPEERALVFASTQDLDSAWETLGDDGLMHGSFTWAWIRAMRDSVAGEPAQETFLRAQARLRSETPYQAPIMLGPAEARLRPFLGVRIDRHGERPIVAVERVDPDGSVVLQGGWANGLSVGTELRRGTSRLRITRILGLGRSVARIEAERARPPDLRPGALLEIAGWTAPPGRPLRVWTPHATGDMKELARQLMSRCRARWVPDPLTEPPTHVLRPRNGGWEWLWSAETTAPLSNRENPNAEALVSHSTSLAAAVARLPPTASLFVQFPAPSRIVDGIAIEGIVRVDDPTSADYILVGRYHERRMEYAWMRPLVRDSDRRNSGLPQRTAWVSDAAALRSSVLMLRRIHAWYVLESPPNTRAPYRLALLREKTNEIVREGIVIGGETYSIALQARERLPASVTPRYYYAFVIDSHGKSFLAFPKGGSVENRFPLRDPAPPEIRLGEASAFEIIEPYGSDTYFLLSTDEPLPNPSILEWNGTRSTRALTTSRWSIERVVFESVPPGEKRN